MTLLTARLSGEELCRVEGPAAPGTARVTVKLLTRDPVLELVDSAGRARAYDLSSAVEEGMSRAMFSFAVGPGFGAEGDCVLGAGKIPTEKDLLNGRGRGIRFQPFYLPECKGDPAELRGRGLFFRGLHFSGQITASYVSLLCICDFCEKSFRLQSFHTGFGGEAYFYCSREPHTLVISTSEEGAPPSLGEPDAAGLARLEARLPRCSACEGTFAYWNPLRCPHCREPYVDFPAHREDRYVEYYGNRLYAADVQRWSSSEEGTP